MSDLFMTGNVTTLATCLAKASFVTTPLLRAFSTAMNTYTALFASLTTVVDGTSPDPWGRSHRRRLWARLDQILNELAVVGSRAPGRLGFLAAALIRTTFLTSFDAALAFGFPAAALLIFAATAALVLALLMLLGDLFDALEVLLAVELESDRS